MPETTTLPKLLLIRRRFLLRGTGAALALRAAGAMAQAYPERPIRIVVPFNAGGATDIVARLIARDLAPRLGQPVVVDNKAGAGGIIGTDAVAKAEPDGYTFVVSLTSTLMTDQFLYDKLPYDVRRDLVLVSRLAVSPVALIVPAGLPVNTGPELLAYVASHREGLSYGSWGVGSFAHLAGWRMSRSQGADMVHVAYKGEAPMLQDLAAGRIQMAYASVSAARPLMEAGRLRIIGVTGPRRMVTLPEVPTLQEQGLRDEVYGIVGFIGMAAPARTPPDVVRRIAREVQAVCEQADVAERFTAMGFSVAAGTPEAFMASYMQDYPVVERLVRESGAKLD